MRERGRRVHSHRRRGLVEAREPRERERDLPRFGRTRGGIFRQHARDQIVERRGEGAELSEPRRLFEEHLREERHHVVGDERRTTDEALEEDAPEREDVRTRIDLGVSARLLRRHVAGRPELHTGHGHAERAHERARDPEVENLDVGDAPAGQEEVPWVDVAVHDPARVRDAERDRGAARDVDRVAY